MRGAGTGVLDGWDLQLDYKSSLSLVRPEEAIFCRCSRVFLGGGGWIYG